MPNAFVVLMATATVLVFAGCAASRPRAEATSTLPPEPTNSVWNGPSSDGIIGFWVYPTVATCAEHRRKAEGLVFAVPATVIVDKHDLERSDLRYCFQVSFARTYPDVVKCESARVHLEYQAESNRYVGSYSFTLKDGTVVQGQMSALFCPPTRPPPGNE